jgi:hypothetical protein
MAATLRNVSDSMADFSMGAVLMGSSMLRGV